MTPSQLVAFCAKNRVTIEQLRDTKRASAARSIRQQLFDKLAAEGMNGREIARLIGLSQNSASTALRRARRRAEREAKREQERAKSKLDERIADILPAEKHVRLRLIADPHPARLYHRRRGDCSRHWTCVDEWIEVHGSDEGACPTKCADYDPKEAA